MVCVGSCEADSESYDETIGDDRPHERSPPDIRIGTTCEPDTDYTSDETEGKCDEKSLLWVKVCHGRKIIVYTREYIFSGKKCKIFMKT